MANPSPDRTDYLRAFDLIRQAGCILAGSFSRAHQLNKFAIELQHSADGKVSADEVRRLTKVIHHWLTREEWLLR